MASSKSQGVRPIFNSLQGRLQQIPSPIYLGLAVIIFAASNSITRKLVDIGEIHLVNGRNPISLCNVLFVGNLCALGLMVAIFHSHWQPQRLRALTRRDWLLLTINAILSGAIAPMLFFTALGQTSVTNIVLIGRLEPLLTLILSVYFLQARLNFWTLTGSLLSLAGVGVTAFWGQSTSIWEMMGLSLGLGEILVAIAAIIGSWATILDKLQLRSVPLGVLMTYRNILGTLIFFTLAWVLYGPTHFAEVWSPFLWQWMAIYAAVIVVGGQLFWLAGLRNATPTQINLASLGNPMVAILMAYIILQEVPTSAQYRGGFLLLLGAILSLIGNLPRYNSPQLSCSPRNTMDTAIGFRGV